ncbi:MAG TPA: hypothetical protein VKP66_03695 [Steroidobacteraceae bacterium]|nr:hypothetical protein [Steroidobacteraceae bacterium]
MPNSLKFAFIGTIGLIGGVLASGAACAGDTAAHGAGVWQKHEYSFQFMGFTTTYSCDGLADKLKTLLIASGARPDAKARAGACSSDYGRPDEFARADLTFYTLAPADSAATSATTDSRPVDGTWKPVAIAAHRPRELGAGDCELVEQFRSNVLGMFTTRNVASNTSCVPHQLSGSNIDLKFESFTAPPKAALQKQAP